MGATPRATPGQTCLPSGDAGLGHSVFSVYFACLAFGAAGVTLPASGTVLRARLAMGDALYGACFLPGSALGILIALAGPLLLRRWSLRRLYLWAVGLPAASLALMALAVSLAQWLGRGSGLAALFVALAVLGVAGGLGGITLNTAAMGIFPRAPGGALTMLHAALGVGATIWPLAVAAAAGLGFWRIAPLALAAVFVAITAAAGGREILGLAARRRPADGRTDVPARLRWRAATIMLYGVVEATFTAWAVIYLTEDRALPLGAAAGALSAFWLALTGGRVLATFVLRRFSPARIAFALTLAMAAAFPIVARAHGAAGSLAAFAFAGLACSACFPVLLSLAADELPERKPQVSAAFSAAVLIGLAVGSFGLGPLRGLMALERIYTAAALVPLLMAGLLIRMRRRRV